jgi:precorrin-6B methylase 1
VLAQPSLVVVGSGIQIGRDLTPAARRHIESADKVLFLVADPIAVRTVRGLNRSAESLDSLYRSGKLRMDTYRAMVERILSFVRAGKRVCVVAYGHPGYFAYPMHEAVRRARREGYEACLLPGISSLDCLISDLLIDPGERGIQILDASVFLNRHRRVDATTALVLLQIALATKKTFRTTCDREGLHKLVDRLRRTYAARHPAVVYEASEFAVCPPSIQHVTVGAIGEARIGLGSTLYVPPIGAVADG